MDAMRDTLSKKRRRLAAVNRRRFLGTLGLVATLAGCSSSSTPNATIVADATTQPLVEQNLLPPASTQPSFVSVPAGADFDRAWQACDDVARALLFRPGLQDRRGGLYQTDPLVSAQWFEPWRRELRTEDARVQASIASIRRTISFHVERAADGASYVIRPDVLIERYSLAERRVTTSASYRSVFQVRTRRNASPGSVESDAGIILPDDYWYSVGNDPDLERYLADKLTIRLAQLQR